PPPPPACRAAPDRRPARTRFHPTGTRRMPRDRDPPSSSRTRVRRRQPAWPARPCRSARRTKPATPSRQELCKSGRVSWVTLWTMTLEQRLEAYAELTVRVALNVRAGQRLLIVGPLMNGGVSLDAAPLVREVAASAYRAGVSLVEAVWGDEEMQLTRFRHAPRDSSSNFSAWLPNTLAEHA